MNKNDDPESRLLAETFHDDWESGPTAAFARTAAAHARRRRRLRASLLAAGTAAGLIAVLATVLRQPPKPPQVAAIAAKPAPAYEIISDDELLARLQDRPLLTVKKPDGTREFILLEN